MMNYEEFKEYVVEHVSYYLPKRYENAHISIEQTIKNNGVVLDGLHIKEAGAIISPVVYINAAYESYQDGKGIEKIVADLADHYIEHISPTELYGEDFRLEDLLDYEQIKDKIGCRLINRDNNQETLSQMPYTLMEDLAVTYYVQMSLFGGGLGSVPINQNLMANYGVDVQTLHEQAMSNMETLSPTVIKPLAEIAHEMLLSNFMSENNVGEKEAEKMLVDINPPGRMQILCVTNKSGINGAACMANPEVQQQVGEIIGEDYYILPSSIHETLVVAKSESEDYLELQEMVQEINQREVAPEERLSDYVYEYDAKEHSFCRSDRAQQRREQLQPTKEVDLSMGNLVLTEPAVSYDMGQQENHEIEPKKHSTKTH